MFLTALGSVVFNIAQVFSFSFLWIVAYVMFLDDHVHTALYYVFSNSLYCGLQSQVSGVEIEVAISPPSPLLFVV